MVVFKREIERLSTVRLIKSSTRFFRCCCFLLRSAIRRMASHWLRIGSQKSSASSASEAWARSTARVTPNSVATAVKSLPDLFANDPERVARFEREAKSPRPAIPTSPDLRTEH